MLLKDGCHMIIMKALRFFYESSNNNENVNIKSKLIYSLKIILWSTLFE